MPYVMPLACRLNKKAYELSLALEEADYGAKDLQGKSSTIIITSKILNN